MSRQHHRQPSPPVTISRHPVLRPAPSASPHQAPPLCTAHCSSSRYHQCYHRSWRHYSQRHYSPPARRAARVHPSDGRPGPHRRGSPKGRQSPVSPSVSPLRAPPPVSASLRRGCASSPSGSTRRFPPRISASRLITAPPTPTSTPSRHEGSRSGTSLAAPAPGPAGRPSAPPAAVAATRVTAAGAAHRPNPRALRCRSWPSAPRNPWAPLYLRRPRLRGWGRILGRGRLRTVCSEQVG